jgi:hypothetical protein
MWLNARISDEEREEQAEAIRSDIDGELSLMLRLVDDDYPGILSVEFGKDTVTLMVYDVLSEDYDVVCTLPYDKELVFTVIDTLFVGLQVGRTIGRMEMSKQEEESST